MVNFSDSLIFWYKEHKRDLPWRHTKDPYKIWLSEIMLQQTRVEQGLPYYIKFLKLFPNVFDLASASEQQVLNAWKGLGYYSRARRLHATSKIVVNQNQGLFPETFVALNELPGVGEYTGAAIASFCYKEVVPVVDGNVYRVLSRLFNIEDPIDVGKSKKIFFDLASELIDEKQPDTFNQAIMEFGALQCVPKNPNCDQCPFMEICEAFHLNKVTELPVKSRKIKRRSRYFTYLVVEKDGKYLTTQRPEKGIWANMMEFPMVETDKKVNNFEQFEQSKLNDFPFEFETYSTTEYRKHILTHQDIHYVFWSVKLKGNTMDQYQFIERRELNNMPFPKLLENFISNL
ncbi:MAG: A/G-specific adenine glycosylase [Glaciecola sp.]|jgi:A/G-specific adenine glycosylase